MSAEESRKVVSRAVMDEDFRNQLFSDPDKALVGYDLTPDEINALRSIPAETIDEFSNNLDERISMSLLYFGADLMGGAVEGGGDQGHADDLVVDISLFRPGPVKSDMVTPFLKARQGWISYQDMLTRVADFIEGEGADDGIRKIRQRYQVAFVDEFQDTDEVQWRIFSTLFLADGDDHRSALGPQVEIAQRLTGGTSTSAITVNPGTYAFAAAHERAVDLQGIDRVLLEIGE